MSQGKKTWRVPRNIISLQFEGEEFEGIEVRAKSLPLGEFFDLQKLQAQAKGDDVAAAEKVINVLGTVLISWNVTTGDDEDDDADEVPVPCNTEGLRSLPMRYVMAILQAWMKAVAVVPNLSASGSNAGGTSQEVSIQMDVSSPSQ